MPASGAATDLARDRAIARGLARTWDPFFARFGRLTAPQRAAIPPILAGEDVLLCAATASGKTEAACAPLVERYIGRAAPWTILYVSPTRALINDLYARLQPPLAALGLRLDRRTSDHRADAERVPGTNVLLTTPESLDSLLCRGRRRRPDGHALAGVVAVVLDEIHLLHGGPRGEQVRWLLERLRRLRRQARARGWTGDDGVQIVALSATVPDATAVRDAYLLDGAIVAVPGGRAIETVGAPGASARVEVALPALLAERGAPEKILVFANARQRVDELTARLRRDLRGLGYAVRAHHGSLDREEREATEAAARGERRIVVFATSTLEIGIDIGDIDLVVLDGPAPDIPALLQRIGRGNRRTGATRVLACADTLLDTVVHAAMIEAARDGWLGEVEHGPEGAVARQQVASYILQGPRIARPRAQVQDLLDACAPSPLDRALLDTMIGNDELRAGPDGLRLGEEWLGRVGYGDIHTVIEDDGGAAVEDEATGRKIATGIAFRAGRGLRAGGHLLEVRRWTDFKIEVRRVADEARAQGDWRYRSRPWLHGAGQPQAVRRYLGLAPDEWPIVPAGDDESACVFHFGGARRRAVLELLAAQDPDAPAPDDITDWLIVLPAGVIAPPPWLTRPTAAALGPTIAARLGRLERTLGRPAANRRLPRDARIAEIGGWLRLDDELPALRRATWARPADPEVETLLVAIGAAILAEGDEEVATIPSHDAL
jgi:ATP-dependent Lhr-like helicase